MTDSTLIIPAPRSEEEEKSTALARTRRELPEILVGSSTPSVVARTKKFYSSVAEMFESWIARRNSPNTRAAYRRDLLSFVEWMGIRWPEQATELLTIGVADVQAYRDYLVEIESAPSTINRRLCSLSSFYKYLREIAAEIRLPVNVPNPAHAQFIPRESSDPVTPTRALSRNEVRFLFSLVEGDDEVAARDRALLKMFLYTGVRIGTACRLEVRDFRQREDGAVLLITEKGKMRGRSKAVKREIGVHFAAAQEISGYLAISGITKGPLFRRQLNSRVRRLSEEGMTTRGMYKLLERYLGELPGALEVHEVEVRDPETGEVVRSERTACVYTPHSLRATTATVLLDAGVDIRKVQKLLGHKAVTTTQIYDKRRHGAKDSASHEVIF